MKLLIATPIYPPNIGGPATYSKLLFEELPKSGVETSVLSFGEVRKYPKGISHFLFLCKLLYRAKSVDVIFAQDTVSVGFPSLLAAKILGKKFFVRVPGDHAWEQSVQRYGVKENIDDFQKKKYGFRVEFLRKIEQITVGGADTTITPSEYFRMLVSLWTSHPETVFCIYNGIDLKVIPKNAGEYEPKTMISAGRLVSWKGYKALIEILETLTDWKLYIAGSGPDEQELRDFAKEKKVEDRVIFLGQISRKELLEKIQHSDVFVLNTFFESFSFQVVEAMASGTPVITTNVGNLAEIVDTGVNGLLVNPDDKVAIIGGLLKFSTDQEYRKSITKKAQEKAKYFSIENTVSNLLKQLEKLKK